MAALALDQNNIMISLSPFQTALHVRGQLSNSWLTIYRRSVLAIASNEFKVCLPNFRFLEPGGKHGLIWFCLLFGPARPCRCFEGVRIADLVPF